MAKENERILKVSFGKAGGNASKNSYSPKLAIPKKWLDEMGIKKDESEHVEVIFDGEKIIITKKRKLSKS